MKPAVSFLNIGSGTGFLSSMVATIAGERAPNHGVECSEAAVAYARRKNAELVARLETEGEHDHTKLKAAAAIKNVVFT